MVLSKEIISPSGSPRAKLWIVGEAPGADEIAAGKPFVGSSGKLLRAILRDVGIDPNLCYITNVVMQRPRNNDIGLLCKPPRFESETYKRYERLLHTTIERYKPEGIIAVGGTALWALTKNVGISKYSGSILTGVHGTKVLPVTHPAAALRNYKLRHIIRAHLRKIQNYRIPDPVYPRKIIAPRSSEAFSNLLTRVMRAANKHTIAFDIEFVNNEVSCISFAWADDIRYFSSVTSIVFPLLCANGNYISYETELGFWHGVKCLLEANYTKVAQNSIYDLTVLRRRYNIHAHRVHDTMVMMGVAYPDMPKDLGTLTSLYTLHPYYKDDRRGERRTPKDWQTYWLYNATDSAVLLPILHGLMGDLQDLGLEQTYLKQLSIIPICIAMGELGIKVDLEAMNTERSEIEQHIKHTSNMLRNHVGFDINHRSPIQLKEYFYKQQKVKPYLSRTTGKVSVNEEALEAISRREKGKPSAFAANLILKLRDYETKVGRYLKPEKWMSEAGCPRALCTYDPIGTKQGRLSSRATPFGEGANLQNIPRELRHLWQADEGCVLATLDYAQAENRIVAYLAQEEQLIAAFERGDDIHKLTASIIFGIPPDQVSSEPGSSGIGTYSQRDIGKRSNHGLNYDMGWKNYAKLLRIPAFQAKRIINKYFAGYPRIRTKFQYNIRKLVFAGKPVTNLLGRKRYYLTRPEEACREAYSFIPQSTVADLMVHYVMPYVHNNRKLQLLLQLHDSVTVQIPIRYGVDTIINELIKLKHAMEVPLHANKTFVIPVDCKVGYDLKQGTEVDLSDEQTACAQLDRLLHTSN